MVQGWCGNRWHAEYIGGRGDGAGQGQGYTKEHRAAVYNKGGFVVGCFVWGWEMGAAALNRIACWMQAVAGGHPSVWGASLEKEFKQCCRGGGGPSKLAEKKGTPGRRACRAAAGKQQQDAAVAEGGGSAQRCSMQSAHQRPRGKK